MPPDFSQLGNPGPGQHALLFGATPRPSQHTPMFGGTPGPSQHPAVSGEHAALFVGPVHGSREAGEHSSRIEGPRHETPGSSLCHQPLGPPFGFTKFPDRSVP